MRRPLLLLLALSLAPTLFAEPAEKPVGRSLVQRFGPIDQSLAYNPGGSSATVGKSFSARGAQSNEFRFDQKVAPAKYETREFGAKTSWFSRLKFWAKDANTAGAHEVPNISRQADTKTAAVKDARDTGKTMAVRNLPGGDRDYLGPERAKLDRTVDPNKPLPGWAGNKLDTLTLEQVRELLNKNK